MSSSQPAKPTLRLAQFEDNAFIASVFEAVQPQYQQIMPASIQANIDNLKILTQKGLDFSATGLSATIVSLQGEPVGFAALGPLSPRMAYMSALYFLPSAQRQGLGAFVLAELEQNYKHKGFQEIVLLVHSQADWARAFYQQQGYRLVASEAAAIIRYAGSGLTHLIEPGLILLAKKL